jgi:hypothetical protein
MAFAIAAYAVSLGFATFFVVMPAWISFFKGVLGRSPRFWRARVDTDDLSDRLRAGFAVGSALSFGVATWALIVTVVD